MLNIKDHTPGCKCGQHFNDAARRYDPTGTTGIRKSFEADLVRRFKRLRRLIIEAVGENDALGLSKMAFGDRAPQRNTFSFGRSDQKVAMFMSWLRDEQNKGILEIQEGVPVEFASSQSWANVYIKRAYKKGVMDAARRLREGGADVAESWVENFFNRPMHADRVGLIYSRTYTDLKGITEAMDAQITRVLANGMVSGKGPMVLAREIAKKVDSIGIVRAKVIAQTEIIRAHAEATLNSYNEAGIEGVDVISEYSTSRDNAVCPYCEELEGKLYTLDDARGVIPLHPNCRCSWNPKVVNGTGIELR